jgi:arabinofuranosyltransferase
MGVLLYCLYVVRIGGDFLSGRLFVPPVFAALLIIVFGATSIPNEVRGRPRQTMAVVAVSLLCLVAAHRAALEYWPLGFIFPRSVAHLKLQPDFAWKPSERAVKWRATGEGYAERARNSDEKVVVVDSTIGFTGFAAGPDVTVIDPLGLGDALIARLPPDRRNRRAWRTGHLPRAIPDGYLEARSTGSLDGLDPDLRRYYEKLSLVTSGSLFELARLRTILGFQLGRYEDILDGWKRRQPGGAPTVKSEPAQHADPRDDEDDR